MYLIFPTVNKDFECHSLKINLEGKFSLLSDLETQKTFYSIGITLYVFIYSF
jgi:hypothetical protein